MSRRDRIKELGATVRFHGTVFDIIEQQVRTPAGTDRYEFAVCDDVVRVYPIDEQGRLWLIKELKPGISDERILRTVAGAIEEGETPQDAAYRELQEELGMSAGSIEVFHESTPMLKIFHNVYHVLATRITLPPAGWQGARDADEDIESFTVNVQEVDKLVWDGEIVEDAIALAIIRLHRRLTSGLLNGVTDHG